MRLLSIVYIRFHQNLLINYQPRMEYIFYHLKLYSNSFFVILFQILVQLIHRHHIETRMHHTLNQQFLQIVLLSKHEIVVV